MQSHIEIYDLCRDFVNDYDTASGGITEQVRLKILGFIRARELNKLCNVRSEFAQYIKGASDHFFLSQVQAFFKKNECFANLQHCRSSAISSFRKSEELCAETNEKLDNFHIDSDQLDPDLRIVIERALEITARLYGDFDDFIGSIPDRIRFTNGACSHRPRSRSQAHRKMRTRLLATVGAVPFLTALGSYYGIPSVRPKVVNYNRVTFVPKSYKTERTIACEPEGNLPLQLAFDDWMKDRLRKFGCDLTSQSTNQRLALLGSQYDSNLKRIGPSYDIPEVSTLDLEAASDTLSYNTVCLLLPHDWFAFLSSIRSPYFLSKEMGGGKYHKFSSMGNGATFALETSIFLVLALALPISEKDRKFISVYGDDIVVPTMFVDLYTRALEFFGFRVNSEKSFTTGPFRESCGEDYYDGTLVTPFYVRTSLALKPDAAHIVNGLVQVSLPEGRLWKRLRAITLQKDLLLVPQSENTTAGVFISTPDAYRLNVLHTFEWQTTFFAYTPKVQVKSGSGARGSFLWHLRAALRKKKNPQLADIKKRALRTSRYDSCVERKFLRKRVHWFGVNPEENQHHLYWWSEYLLSDLPRDSGGEKALSSFYEQMHSKEDRRRRR